MVSCTADSPAEPNNGKGSELLFSVSDVSRTPAPVAFDRFAVYGDMKSSENNNAAPIVIFDKTEVERKDDVWSYQGTQYWFPNYEHRFVAVSPLTVLEAENAPQYDNSKLTFTYALPTSNGNLVNYSQVADIVAATHRRLYSENDANNVTTFRFVHLLSLINFSLELNETSMKNNEYFKIHKLEMSGFGISATINIKPASRQTNSQTDDSEIDIVTANGNGSLEISFEEDPIEVINGVAAVKMFDGNNAIIMLPQTFGDNDKVEITLTYSENDGEEETQVSATLSNFTWKWGKSYNYKIKLELEEKDVNMVISNAIIIPWELIEDPDYVVDAR